MGGVQQVAVGSFLWISAVLTTLATVQGAGTSFSTPSLDISFQLAVQGLGAATFYTFQQQLPHPTLPYAVHDEWVQYAYPDGSAAVYNVAQVSAAAAAASEHSSSSLISEQLNNQCSSIGNDVSSRCHEAESLQLSQPRRGLQPSGSQEYVAVRANDAVGYLSWFQQYSASMLQFSTREAPGPAKFTQDVVNGQVHVSAPLDPKDSSSTRSAMVSTVGAEYADPASVVGLVEQAYSYAKPLLPQQPHTDQPIEVPFGGLRGRHEHNTCEYRNFMLYFGMSIPLSAGGGTVSQKAMQSFLDAEVTSRVQGFMIIKAQGFWEGEIEQTVVLEVISDAANAYVAVQEIAEAYKRYFRQQAVLVKEQVCPVVQFI